MKNLVLTICIMCFAVFVLQAQEPTEQQDKNLKVGESNIRIKGEGTIVQRAVKPEIYVNGKKFDFPMELIDQSKVESISVIKGEEAKKKYNTTNAVLLVTTKKDIESANEKIKIRATGSFISEEEPLIIINGEEVSGKEKLEELSPREIEDITVIKGASATSLYGNKAANGVIIVTTGKEKK